MTYLTKDEIVNDLKEKISSQPDEVEYLRKVGKDELGILHHGFGTFIRNHYGLWQEANPLTKAWFDDCKNPEDKEHQFIIDGVDHHPQHPDQVSFDIITELWNQFQEKQCTE